MLFFYASPGAYVLCEGLLATGWELNMTMSQKAGMQGRDYLVPKPTPDLSGFRRALVKYQDAVTMSRALLMALRADVTLAGKDGPEPGGLLLNQVSTGFWSEHLERGTINIWPDRA